MAWEVHVLSFYSCADPPAPPAPKFLSSAPSLFTRLNLFLCLIWLIAMFTSLLSIVLGHWPSTLLILVLVYLARNYFNHGLNSYPGPFLASLTNWWRFFDVYGRRPELTHTKLHRQYGDVVRLGPNLLSFGNPVAVKQIYGLNRGFVKVLDDIAPLYDVKANLLVNSQASIPCRWLYVKVDVCHHCSRPQTRLSMPTSADPLTMPSQ